MKIVVVVYDENHPGHENQSMGEWDLGTDMAAELLSDINSVSKRNAPFRLDTEDYKVYWAGNVLRVDIAAKAVT
jgi:hypothetical protein